MIELTDKPIDVGRVLESVRHPKCGAEVLFVGTTRQWTTLTRTVAGSSITEPVETSHLLYDAYREMALEQLRQLADEAMKRWPVLAVSIVHRLGRVDPTEPSVAVAVSCPHRSEAFDAAEWLINTLKHDVPIWKQEHYVQGGEEWIHPTSGSCRCDHEAPAEPPSNPKSSTFAR